MKTASKPQSLAAFKKELIRSKLSCTCQVGSRVPEKLHLFLRTLALTEDVREADVFRQALWEFALARGWDPHSIF